MKLEKYVDKDKKRRKVILISISAIVLISISFLLYKTFASFTESAEFPIMNGKVDYFGNSDIYFVFYKGNDELLDEMPQKGNEENLVFDHGECDNGASIEWNIDEWAPLVKGLNSPKTKCSLYFKEQTDIQLDKNVEIVENGDGLYKVEHNDLEELDSAWNKTEYRYAGTNPNNYILFNNEIWRIIGLVNVMTANGVEQRIKIIRTNDIEWQESFGLYAWDYNDKNDWTTSTLKDMLNGIYYNGQIGKCYIDDGTVHESICDFTGNGILPKGLDELARNMIDKEVKWNLGGNAGSDLTASQFYEKERGFDVYENGPIVWDESTDDEKKYNGVGLMYPSDYGYAVGGELRETFLDYPLSYYYIDISSCLGNWLFNCDDFYFHFLSPNLYDYDMGFSTNNTGGVDSMVVTDSQVVYPTVYLKKEIKIVDGTGDINSPFVLSIQ